MAQVRRPGRDGRPGVDPAAGHDTPDELDNRGELRPQRHELGAATLREDLVERRAAGEPNRDDREDER